jgi:hypothetical protein
LEQSSTSDVDDIEDSLISSDQLGQRLKDFPSRSSMHVPTRRVLLTPLLSSLLSCMQTASKTLFVYDDPALYSFEGLATINVMKAAACAASELLRNRAMTPKFKKHFKFLLFWFISGHATIPRRTLLT